MEHEVDPLRQILGDPNQIKGPRDPFKVHIDIFFYNVNGGLKKILTICTLDPSNNLYLST